MVKIPSRLEDLVPAGAVEKVLEALQQPDISGKVREALDRVGMRDANPVEHVQHAFRQARSWFESFTRGDDATGRLATLINATGSLLRDPITRMPISTAVAHVYAKAVIGFQNAGLVETLAEQVAASTLGHTHGSWHVSTADALSSLLSTKTVLIPKRDLVRIPGMGDIGSLLRNSDIREVGATNGCSRDDWQQSLAACLETSEGNDRSATACVLIVSPNGTVGEQTTNDRQVAIECAKQAGLPVYELVADGVMSQRLTEEFGFPNLKHRLNNDVAAVVAPLQLLIGAPAGALVYGHEQIITSLRRTAALAGTALTGPDLLAAVAALQMGEADKVENGPAACLLINPENLRNRAERLAVQAIANDSVREALVCERTSPLGPPPWDKYKLENVALELQVVGKASDFCDSLFSTKWPQQPESVEDTDHAASVSIASVLEDDRVLLDLRFVDPKDDHLIALALAPTSESSDGTEP